MIRELLELLTVEQTAAKLKLSPDTIRRKLRDKQIPGVKLGKGEWRVPAKALEEFIRSGGESDPKPPASRAR